MARGWETHIRGMVTLIGLLLLVSAPTLAQSATATQPEQSKKKQTSDKTKAKAQAKQPPQTKSKKQPSDQVKQSPPMPPSRPFQQPSSMPAPPTTAPPSPEQTERAVQNSVPAPIRASETQLNMVRTAPEQIGQVPSHFFWIRQNLQAVRDPVDGAIVFLNDEGRVTGRAKLPTGFDIREILAEAEQIRLFNAGRHITISRNIDPASTTALQDSPAMANGEARLLRLTRRGPQHLVLQEDRRVGTRALDVRSLAGGQLAQAYEIGSSGDNRYVVSEEIIGSKPSLQVRVFVQRFDREGKLSGVAHVTLDGMDSVPRDFIAVTGDGVLRVLVPKPDSIAIREIAFSVPPAGNARGADQLRSLGRTIREVPVDSNVNRPEGFGRFPRSGDVRFKIDPPTPPISRENVIRNASAYLSVDWVMAPENFARAGIENECVPTEAKFWRRPTRFTSAAIGQTIGPMPYRWGGDDTPQTFRLRLEWGALAGSVCTCRNPALDYCISPESIGIDCSGLVSRAWGIEKRGTSGLLDVSTELNSVADIKPGDAFNWSGRHIRLFVGNTPGAATAYTVIESATRLECEGVCMRSYRPSELYGYKIIRYRGITE